MRKFLIGILSGMFAVAFAGSCDSPGNGTKPPPEGNPPVSEIESVVYLTKPDASAKFKTQEGLVKKMSNPYLPAIVVDKDQKFQQVDGFGFTPVSYTHLRAHETVLDLVCRLLLEKKKNHEYQTTLYSQDFLSILSYILSTLQHI